MRIISRPSGTISELRCTTAQLIQEEVIRVIPL